MNAHVRNQLAAVARDLLEHAATRPHRWIDRIMDTDDAGLNILFRDGLNR